MANASAPRGFHPVRMLDGSPYNGAHVLALIPSSDGTAVYVGDPVKVNGASGTAGTVVAGMDCEGMPQVIRVAAGTTGQDIFGVVVGFYADPTSLGTRHRAASTNRIAQVALATKVIFEIQEDAATTPVASTSVGLNAAFTTTAGSATTGQSAIALDSDSVNTTSTLPIRIVGLTKRVGNAFNTAGAGSDPATFDVWFNTSMHAHNIAGV